MKRRSPIHAYKRLLADDQDWDYAYLIALEKKKLQRMRDYIDSEGHYEGKELTVRELAICIRLIDILRRTMPSITPGFISHSLANLNFANWRMTCMNSTIRTESPSPISLSM